MDKLEKFLSRLKEAERERLETAIRKILNSDLTGLDIKRLKGKKQLYRVRLGDLRIIFSRKAGRVMIHEASRRSEKTYRDI